MEGLPLVLEFEGLMAAFLESLIGWPLALKVAVSISLIRPYGN